jgi:Ca2+-binding RTX toxin-like protein
MKATKKFVSGAAAVALVAGVNLIVPQIAQAAAPKCFGRTATIVGTKAADTIKGTPRADVIVGLAGADSIEGGGGDDRICGGNGTDRLWGDGGSDRIASECGECSPGYIQKVSGGTGDDQLFGSSSSDQMIGGRGEDRLMGLGALYEYRDIMNGGDDDDLLVTGTRTGEEPDTGAYANGQRGADELRDLDGTAELLGGIGDDLIVGADSCCTVANFQDGPAVTVDLAAGRAYGRGIDVLVNIQNARGSSFDDTFIGSNLGDHIYGEGGADTVDAGNGDDRILGGPGNDDLDGGEGNDVFDGQQGDDVIFGRAGDDFLDGGGPAPWEPQTPDVNTLDGGDGSDICYRGQMTNCEYT